MKYADLSGQWEGSCSEKPTDIFTLSIKSDPNYIILDGVKYEMGNTLNTQKQTDEEGESYQHTVFNWSNDGQSIILNSTVAAKYSSSLTTFLVEQVFTINDLSQLTVNMHYISYQNLTKVPEETSQCVLYRK
jgi:hypothetical protein